MNRDQVIKIFTDGGYTVNRHGVITLQNGRLKFGPKAMRIERKDANGWYSIGSQYYGKLTLTVNQHGCTILGEFLNYQLYSSVSTVNLNITNILKHKG